MAVTSGFFNSVNHDRKYNANQFSTLFEGIINDGVFASIGTSLVVTANAGMNINVGVGRAWFNRTWTDNDAILPLVVPAAEMVLNRIDAVVVEVDTSDAVRLNTIKVVKGIPASVPVNPVMTETATIHQHPLCYIYVGATVTVINQVNITNLVGTVTCPFITGILETMTIEGVTTMLEAEFNTWFDNLKAQLEGNVATNLQNQINDINELKTSTPDVKNIIYETQIGSYMQFCANTSATSLNAAFGAINESLIGNIGKQMAMYAWFMGRDKLAYPYLNLSTKNTLAQIVADIPLKESIVVDSVLLTLILNSPWACSAFFSLASPLSDAVRTTILFDSTLRTLVLNNANARTVLFGQSRPIIVYDKGDEKLTITNGYTAGGNYGGTGTKMATQFLLTGASSGGSGAMSTTLKFLLPNINRCVMNLIENNSSSNYFNLLATQQSAATMGLLITTGLRTITMGTTSVDLSFMTQGSGGRLALDYVAFYCA